ncbi:MAG: polysaccharide deacetylase family protein, partial [Rhodothermales bacterium]
PSSACSHFQERKQIAISIDDAPVVSFHSYPSQFERRAVVDSITTALELHKAPATIFVVGNQADEPDEVELFRHWLTTGVSVGNHSLTHRSFDELTPEEGRLEIDETNRLIQSVTGDERRPVRYFRFPYLAEGETIDDKSLWEEQLSSRGLRNARVTISNNDWKFDSEYAQAELDGDWERRYEIGQAYLQHMRESVVYWDSLAQALTGRNVKHVLLIHANRINRDYLGSILQELSSDGYEFISLEEAYSDPIYSSDDEWASANGTSFLENVKQTQIQRSKLASAP